MAFSEGPVQLSDVMKIKGTRIQLSNSKTPQSADPELAKQKQQAVFLSIWEAGIGTEGEIVRPSIHHFCTHPKEPQLPVHMQVLSRTTHVKPGVVTLKTSRESLDMQISIKSRSVEKGVVSKGLGFPLQSESRVRFSSLPKKRLVNTSVRSSRGNLTTPGTTPGSLPEGGNEDIVSIAKTRLKHELREENSPNTSASFTPDAKGQTKRVWSKEGRRSRESQRSWEREQSRRSERSEDGAMVLTGTKMRAANPARYSCSVVQ